MKRLAFAALFICLCAVVIGGLGGVYLIRFVRFSSTTPLRPPASPSQFVPKVFPDTDAGVYRQVIPGLSYVYADADSEAQIYVGIIGYDSYGYADVQSFTIESFEVVEPSGRTFFLVPASDPITYTIEPNGMGSERISLGHCSGDQFTTRLRGRAILRTGAEVLFDRSDHWEKKSQTSLRFGISLAE